MASQTQPITTTDVVDYMGPAIFLGAKYGKSPLISEATLRNGFKVSGSTQFPMANFIEGDAPAQDGVTEDASIGAGSDTSYTGTQTSNYMQIFQDYYIQSDANSAFQSQISGVATIQEPKAGISTLGTQREAHVKQTMSDYEYCALYGTAQAWTNAATAGKMDGVLQEVEAGSETAAGGATLSKDLINTEIKRMAAAGAEFNDPWIVGNAHQIQVLNELYGNPIMSQTAAGTNIQTILLPVAGPCKVLYNPVLNTDDLGIIDLQYFVPVYGVPEGKNAGMSIELMARTTAGRREMLYMLASIDYGNVAYHGMVSGLATS